jgi:hypothetical protein
MHNLSGYKDWLIYVKSGASGYFMLGKIGSLGHPGHPGHSGHHGHVGHASGWWYDHDAPITFSGISMISILSSLWSNLSVYAL